jgi:hypothetical protein
MARASAAENEQVKNQPTPSVRRRPVPPQLKRLQILLFRTLLRLTLRILQIPTD